MRDRANAFFFFFSLFVLRFVSAIAPSALTFKVKLAVHLRQSHNDSAPAPLEFNIYASRKIKAENGASFIAAIQ